MTQNLDASTILDKIMEIVSYIFLEKTYLDFKINNSFLFKKNLINQLNDIGRKSYVANEI